MSVMSIPPDVWPAIEASVMRLMLDAYDAGMRRGLGSDRAQSPDPAVEWLIEETARRWDEAHEARLAIEQVAAAEALDRLLALPTEHILLFPFP